MFSQLVKESSSEMSLDEIFELQTLDLTKCILELNDLSDLKLIRKWHNILCRAKPNELRERNEFCALMLDQLRKQGKLCSMFRNERNEHKPLVLLLMQLKRELAAEQKKLQNQIPIENEEHKEEADLDLINKTTPSRTTLNTVYYPKHTRHQINPNELKQLERNVENLQVKLDSQNETLKILSAKLKRQEISITGQKRHLTDLMTNVVNHFQNYFDARSNGSKLPLKLFQKNFAHLTTDPEIHCKMKELDKTLERAFNSHAKNVRNSVKVKIENKTAQCTNRIRNNMLEEFESMAQTQLWVQEVRLRALRQQFLANLRQHLTKFKSEKSKVNFNIEKVLKLVDREYKRIFEDIGDDKLNIIVEEG